MASAPVEQICLIDNATLNQSAIALARRVAGRHEAGSSPDRQFMQGDDPAFNFDAAPEAFIASLASLVQSIVLYERVFVLEHRNHVATWERYDLHDDIQRRVRSFSLSRVELQAARELAIVRLDILSRSPDCIAEFTALLRKLNAVSLRKSSTMVRSETEQDDFLRDRDEDREDVEELIAVFERVMRHIVGKKGKSSRLRRSPKVDKSIAYSLFYWLYFRTLYYGAIAEIFNGRSRSREVVHVPALVRSQHARMFLDCDTDALTLVERIVRNGELAAVRKLKAEYPDLPLVRVDVPPVFAYVLEKADGPRNILSVAREIGSSDPNVRALREELAALRAALVQGREGVPRLLREIGDINAEISHRWSTQSDRLVESISLGYNGATPTISAAFLTDKLKKLLGATRPRGVVSVLSSFRAAVNNVNSMGALHDKHFWRPVDPGEEPGFQRPGPRWSNDAEPPRTRRSASSRRRRQARQRDTLEEDKRREMLRTRNAELAKEFDKIGPAGEPVNRPKGKDAPWQPKGKRLVDPMAAAIAAIKASWSS